MTLESNLIEADRIRPTTTIPGSRILWIAEMPEITEDERKFMFKAREEDEEVCVDLDSEHNWFCERRKGHEGAHAAVWSTAHFIAWGWPEDEEAQCLLSVEVAP